MADTAAGVRARSTATVAPTVKDRIRISVPFSIRWVMLAKVATGDVPLVRAVSKWTGNAASREGQNAPGTKALKWRLAFDQIAFSTVIAVSWVICQRPPWLASTIGPGGAF